MESGDRMRLIRHPKEKQDSPTAKSEPSGPNHHLYAINRRLEARVKSLEAQESTLRRDINRIERKLNRDAQEVPVQGNTVNQGRAIPWPLPDPFRRF